MRAQAVVRAAVVATSILALALACATGRTAAQTAAKKPRVPVGVDPGGIAVAVIGDGIDYTRPDIAARLARDGEGEIIGFDLVDRDRLPYAAMSTASPCPGASGCAREHPAETVLARAPAARVGIFRVAGTDLRQTAEAIAMVARSPARIVLFQVAPPADLLREAAQRFPGLQFEVPSPDTGSYPPDVARLSNVTVGCRAGSPAESDIALDGACASAAVGAALATLLATAGASPR